jgi:PPM family protein phosphatase
MSVRRTPYLTCSSLTEKGPIRQRNADAILADERIEFFAVADGVGSRPESAEASTFAVKQALAAYEQSLDSRKYEPNLAELFTSIIHMYNKHFDTYAAVPKTTLSIGYFHNSSFFYSNIGDSPVLLIDQDRITLLTDKHTLVDRFTQFADFSLMKSLSGSNVLYNYLGLSGAVPNIYKPLESTAPFRILLATDGLFDFLSQADLLDISRTNSTPKSYIERVMSAAAGTEPRDNYSLIVIDRVP